MQLTLDSLIQTRGNNFHLCMEPNGSIYSYSVAALGNVENSKDAIVNGTYTNMDLKPIMGVFTDNTVDSLGIKNYPTIGAYGYYRTKYSNRTIVKVPIIEEKLRYAPPILNYYKLDRRVHYAITDPTDITYVCYRLEFRSANIAYEYITYDKVGSIAAPYPGNYVLRIMGYYDPSIVSNYSVATDIIITDTESGLPITDYTQALPESMSREIARLDNTKIDTLVARSGLLDTVANGNITNTYAIAEKDAIIAFDSLISSTSVGKNPVLPVLPIDNRFSIENNLIKITLSSDATLTCELSGACGGKGGGAEGVVLGGFGAKLIGTFDLKKNDILYVLLGQQGQDVTGGFGGGDRCTAGGGGMSGIVLVDNTSTDKLFGTIPVRPLLIAGGGNGGGDASFDGTNGANARLDIGTDGNFTATDYAGGGFRAFRASTNCGQSFLSGGAAASAVYTRNGSSEAGFGGGGGNKDDGQGGGGGGYYGGICGGVGGSSFNADPNGTATLCTTRTSGSIKLLTKPVTYLISTDTFITALEQPLANIDDTLATKIDNVSVNGDKIIFNANDTKVSEVDNGAIFVDKEW